MAKRYSKEELEEQVVEFIQCPYCGAKLERVHKKEKSLIPTSCEKCKHHNFSPNMKNVVFIDNLV